MMSADQQLVPFSSPIPSDQDLGLNLGSQERGSSSLGSRRLVMPSGFMIFLWLLVAGLLAMTAIYHVVYDGPGSRLLAWSASAGAVLLLLGATILRQRAWSFATPTTLQQAMSFLYLTAFTVPTLQLLLTLVVSQDLSYTTYVLLLMIGYTLLAPSTESLLVYLTITLATWSACALRCPEGAWMGYVLPWAGTVGLALFIHTRLMSRIVPDHKRKPRTSSVIDIDLHIPLQEALADRDRALAARTQLELEVHRLQQAASSRTDSLPFLQAISLQLAQDVTLQDIGSRWLGQLVTELHAQQAWLWVSEPDQPLQLAVSTTSEEYNTEESLVQQAIQAGTIIQNGMQWCCPLDLGLHGRGVLLVQGVVTADRSHVQSLLQTAAAMLSVFMRWQLAEAESDDIAQESHQHRERSQQLQIELVNLETTHRKVHEHLRSQWENAQQELKLLKESTTDSTKQVDHWKSEAERYQKLLETAQTEHDTLSQLLDEAEAELKKLQTVEPDSKRIKELEIKLSVTEAASETARQQLVKTEQRLKASEADRESAESNWNAAEKQLQQTESRLRELQQEVSETQREWEKELETTSRLASTLRGMSDAIVVFDPSGTVLLENDAARRLRGTARNGVAEHPLWKQVMTDALYGKQKSWTGEVNVSGNVQRYQVSMQPLLEQQTLLGYAITARVIDEEEKLVPTPNKEENLAGAKFFGGLAQTLEPPLSHLIQHADTLLDSTSDQSIRRQALVGILQQGRYVRLLLEQAVDFAQLEAGQAPVVKAGCSAWQVVQHVVAQQRPSAEEKGLTLSLQPVGAMPASITTDATRFTAVLQQLVSQAIRSTQSGTVIVQVGLEQQKPSLATTGRLKFNIMTGTTEQPIKTPATTLVAEFKQTILRRQVQAIGGELESETSSATTLILPVSNSELLNLAPMDRLRFDQDALPNIEWDQPLRGHVLVVMDGQEQQRVTTYQLERLGLRCEVLADAEQAVNRIHDDWFDVVLWDVNKHDVGFVKAAQHLRSHFYRGAILGVGTPLLPAQRDEFLAAGGDNLLSTPIVPAIWRHTLAGFLAKKPEVAQQASDSILSEYHADREFLPLISSYVGKLASHLADMRAALQVADVARLARLSHALYEAGKLYGYPMLSEAGHQLEKLVLQGRDASDQAIVLDHLGALVKKIENGMKLNHSSGFLVLPSLLTKAA